jgi:hydrogenase maturation protein HypF
LPYEYIKYLRHGDEERAVLQRQLEKGLNVTMTSSCGRILDAASVILEIAHERTYEGEPAMKLEAAARGEPIRLPVEIREEEGVHECIPFVEFGEGAKTKMGKVKIIMTKPMLEAILEKYMSGVSRDILATSVLETLGGAFSAVAIEKARELDVKKIGFSGGCAYNTVMAHRIKSEVRRAGLEFLLPDVPCGDGGISYGQACAARYLGENDG